MESPSPLSPGSSPAPQSPGLTSHTVGLGGEMDFDQTIKIKTPGSGMMVFNRYKLDRVLGRGGMGVVWLADDMKLERLVALKFLPSLIGLDPAAVKELKTETRRGLELSHPHIVRIYDFVDDEDAAAISMEFVDGSTLSEMRMNTDHGVFTVEDVSRWLPGVCDALDYAHFQRKLVHRDLKPANIMVTLKDDVPKIADFGIARSLADTMSRLSAAHIGTSGTLPYMSPQQAMGERPGPTDDVYSLGATIYELLSGKPPFYRGDLPTQINSKIPPAIFERRSELEIRANDSVPKEWEQAIAACLNKDPALRPESAGALAAMLGLKAGGGTGRTSVTFSGGATAATAKLPAQAEASGSSGAIKWVAAAAAAVIVGGGAWYLTRPTPPLIAGTSPTQHKVPEAVKETTPSSAATATPTKNSASVEEPGKTAAATSSPENTTAANTAKPVVDSPPIPANPGATVSPDGPATMPPGVVAAITPPPGPGPSTVATIPTGSPMTSTPDSAAAEPPKMAVLVPSDTPLPGTNPTVVPSTPATPTAATPGNVPSTPSGSMSLEPGAPPPSLPVAMTNPPHAINFAALPPGTILPAGTIIPPGTILPTGVTVAPPTPTYTEQPTVTEPPTGFWAIPDLYQASPYSDFSLGGKRWVLYRAQGVLKERGYYNSTIDGKEGKGTHQAIQNFQVGRNLKPTGLLDGPTLTAMGLVNEDDKDDWESPGSKSSGSSGGSSQRSYGNKARPTKEEPSWFQRQMRRIVE